MYPKFYQTRFFATFFIFFMMSIVIFYYAGQINSAKEKIENNDIQQNDAESIFTNIQFFFQGASQRAIVTARKLFFSGDEYAEMYDASGRIFDKKLFIDFKAGYINYQRDLQKIYFKTNVQVDFKKSYHKTDELTYFMDTKIVESVGHVESFLKDPKTSDELVVTSSYMKAKTDGEFFEYKHNVELKLSRKRKYESGYFARTDFLGYDASVSTLNMTGNIKLSKDNYVLTAGRANFLLENHNKTLKYFTFYDDVKMEEKMPNAVILRNGKKDLVRRAFAEEFEGFISDRLFVLSGSPKVVHGDNVIKGYRIILKEKVDLVEVEESQSKFKLPKKEKNAN